MTEQPAEPDIVEQLRDMANRMLSVGGNFSPTRDAIRRGATDIEQLRGERDFARSMCETAQEERNREYARAEAYRDALLKVWTLYVRCTLTQKAHNL